MTMKILIDNDPLPESLPTPHSFPEFCEQIMNILLTRNRSIGSCELDGTLVKNIEEADELFLTCKVCKIASIPLAVALEAALAGKVSDGRRLEQECSDMVTQVLLGEPQEIATRWQKICEEIKEQVGFLPRLTGLLSEAQVTSLVDRELKELGRVMHALHTAFNHGDTLEISDSIELRLLPWLRKLRGFLENCLQLVKNLHR
jgi:hypothetical protein